MSPPPTVLVAGLDGRSLPLEAPMLHRQGCRIEERASGRLFLGSLADPGVRLGVLGAHIRDLRVDEVIRRARADLTTRHVSLLVLVPVGEPASLERDVLSAGANVVMRRPLDRIRLEAAIAKLLVVPRRVETRVLVEGQVIGALRAGEAERFSGVTRNVSSRGMLLACTRRLDVGLELELEIRLPFSAEAVRALGHVVRETDVGWPYIGYGIEFIAIPVDTAAALDRLIVSLAVQAPRPPGSDPVIHSTVRHDPWIYEILAPAPKGGAWLVEIRRTVRDRWRPGAGSPFFVVSGSSPTEALREARRFLDLHAGDP